MLAAVSHIPLAASSGSFLITPSVGLMIWTLLLFGISMWILWRLAFPRISEALDRR
jgi:F-type H+-transporting ATPase subunit b